MLIILLLVTAVILFVIEAIPAVPKSRVASKAKLGWVGLAFFAMAHFTVSI